MGLMMKPINSAGCHQHSMRSPSVWDHSIRLSPTVDRGSLRLASVLQSQTTGNTLEKQNRKLLQFGTSNPLQCSLFICPEVTDHEEAKENGNLCDAKPSELFVTDRPRKQKYRFHIENHEQNRDNVEPHRIAAA